MLLDSFLKWACPSDILSMIFSMSEHVLILMCYVLSVCIVISLLVILDSLQWSVSGKVWADLNKKKSDKPLRGWEKCSIFWHFLHYPLLQFVVSEVSPELKVTQVVAKYHCIKDSRNGMFFCYTRKTER